MRRLLVLTILLLPLAAGCSISRKINERVLLPSQHDISTPEEFGLAAPDVKRLAHDGVELQVEYFRGEREDDVVLLVCGSSGNRTCIYPYISRIVDLGFSAATYDHRGFGKSTGEPSCWRLEPDLAAVIDYLRDERGVERISLWGISLGGVAALSVHDDYPDLVSCMILEGIPDPMKRVRDETNWFLFIGAWLWYLNGTWDIEGELEDCEIPCLVIMGDDDDVTPLRHIDLQKVSDAENQNLWIASGAGHTPFPFLLYGRTYEQITCHFLQTNLDGEAHGFDVCDAAVVESRTESGDPVTVIRVEAEGVTDPVPTQVSVAFADGAVEYHHVLVGSAPRWIPLERTDVAAVSTFSPPGSVTRVPEERTRTTNYSRTWEWAYHAESLEYISDFVHELADTDADASAVEKLSSVQSALLRTASGGAQLSPTAHATGSWYRALFALSDEMEVAEQMDPTDLARHAELRRALFEAVVEEIEIVAKNREINVALAPYGKGIDLPRQFLSMRIATLPEELQQPIRERVERLKPKQEGGVAPPISGAASQLPLFLVD